MSCQDPSNSGRCLVRLRSFHFSSTPPPLSPASVLLTPRGSSQILQATFQDGTPCGFAGRCKSGECHANSNGLETAKAWCECCDSVTTPSPSWFTDSRFIYTCTSTDRDNLKIAIPVTVVVGRTSSCLPCHPSSSSPTDRPRFVLSHRSLPPLRHLPLHLPLLLRQQEKKFSRPPTCRVR